MQCQHPTGLLAPSPDTGSLPSLLMIMKLICVPASYSFENSMMLSAVMYSQSLNPQKRFNCIYHQHPGNSSGNTTVFHHNHQHLVTAPQPSLQLLWWFDLSPAAPAPNDASQLKSGGKGWHAMPVWMPTMFWTSPAGLLLTLLSQAILLLLLLLLSVRRPTSRHAGAVRLLTAPSDFAAAQIGLLEVVWVRT